MKAYKQERVGLKPTLSCLYERPIFFIIEQESNSMQGV